MQGKSHGKINILNSRNIVESAMSVIPINRRQDINLFEEFTLQRGTITLMFYRDDTLP